MAGIPGNTLLRDKDAFLPHGDLQPALSDSATGPLLGLPCLPCWCKRRPKKMLQPYLACATSNNATTWAPYCPIQAPWLYVPLNAQGCDSCQTKQHKRNTEAIGAFVTSV